MRKVYGIVLGLLILASVVSLGIRNYDHQPAQLWDGMVYISDTAGLLSDDEENRIREVMKDVSRYGNAVMVCAYTGVSDSVGYAYDYYTDLCGIEPGVILLIDMTNRQIYMHTFDSVNEIVDRNKALVITDNVYQYASKGNYYQCVKAAFEQVLATLLGKKISESMRYIINACLALVISLFVNYILVSMRTNKKKRSAVEIIKGAKVRYHIENASLKVIHTSQIESSGGGSGGHSSKSGSGSRSSSSSRSSSGSSRRSGSGGGHRF